MDKSIHDVFSLGGHVLINKQSYVIEGAMVLGTSEKMYSVLDVTGEKNEHFVLGVDIQSNTLFSLSSEQQNLYFECIKLHEKRLINNDNANTFDFKQASKKSDHSDIISKIVTNDKVEQSSSKLSIGTKIYCVAWYSLMITKQGDSLIVSVSEEDMMSGLSRQPLYDDIDLTISLSDYDIKHRGNIVRVEKTNLNYLLYIHGYPIEVMQSTQGKGTVFKNIVSPFSIMDFVVNHADSGVTGVVYPHSDEKPVHNYIIAGVLRNINIDIKDCVVGNVRIGTQIDTSEEFINAISDIGTDMYTIIWVNVDADSLYNAFCEGKKLLVAATDFLSFLLKNDMYSDWFGTLNSENPMWDVRSHYPQISLGKVFYIENCIVGESITLTDENIRIPSAIKMDAAAEYLFDCDWIEIFFRKLQTEDEKILRLRYALKWITAAWGTEDPYDKIIYCSMALEFIVNGEKGSNIFDEYAKKFGIQKLTKKERRDVINDVYEKAKIDNLNGFSEENLAELNESVKNMIRSKLSEPSFGSKLDNLINRLAIPISTDEKDLLNKARKIRNELIHGLNMSTISTLEMKKLCGITSRVLIYKLIDGLNKE